MMGGTQPLMLLAAVAAVGVLHTLVPDHWMPIVLMARQHGWSRRETAQAALRAGIGHAVSTLTIALVVWVAGAATAGRVGHAVDTGASLALIGFGGWIALSAWHELSSIGHAHGHAHGHAAQAHGHAHVPWRVVAAVGHAHLHRHGDGTTHVHWHEHVSAEVHDLALERTGAPLWHDHAHKTAGRGALLLILGSSPMIEGIPAFFAASRFGLGLLAAMAAVFTAGTLATYILLCVHAAARLQRLQFGGFERYGEVLSGTLIAAIGLAFWIWPGA